MRMKVQTIPCFPFHISAGQKVVREYQKKYNTIDQELDNNHDILNVFHNDLKKFAKEGGRESQYSSEQILRVIIIKFIEQLSFRDLVIRLEHDDFLRNFARIGMDTVMHFSFIDCAFKCISATTWAKINDLLSCKAIETGLIDGEKLRLDSTVSESNIHYPTDSSLLWDVYRVLSREMRNVVAMDRSFDMGYRFHDRKIKKAYVYVSTHCGKKNKSTIRKVAYSMKLLVERTEEIVKKAECFVKNSKTVCSLNLSAYCVCETIEHRIPLAKKITDQSRRAQINGETVPAVERIFSFFEEHTELLKRGKAHKPVEFGHLISIAQTAQKFITYYAVEQTSRHDTEYKDEVLVDHKRRFKKYPSVFTADKNYYKGAEDIECWESQIPTYAIGKKGNRNKQEYQREHSIEFQDAQRFRAGCEGSISVLKRVFGLRRCLYKGFRVSRRQSGVWCSVITLYS
jgi:transposase, IS5 family